MLGSVCQHRCRRYRPYCQVYGIYDTIGAADVNGTAMLNSLTGADGDKSHNGVADIDAADGISHPLDIDLTIPSGPGAPRRQ